MVKEKNLKKYNKSIFLIIYALRYDILDNTKLYPTLSKLARDGIFKSYS